MQEDCNIQNVWLMGGLSILTSVPIMPQSVCLLCASKGQHDVRSSFQNITKYHRIIIHIPSIITQYYSKISLFAEESIYWPISNFEFD